MGLFGRLLGRRRSRWDETWQTFPGTIDGAAAVWTVDLAAVEAAPVADLSVRMLVVVPYPAATDGMPTDPAYLAQVEDAVRAVAAGLGGEYVGRVVGGGVGRLAAHLPSEPPEPVELPGVPEARVETAYDPHWAYVRDTLAPDERQVQLLSDLAVVGVLSGQGDPLAAPREVAHVAYFAEQAAAEDAAADLRAEGFAASVQRDDEGEFALTAVRNDPVAPPTVHELTWAVKETVERHGGMYDGWSCAVEGAHEAAA